MRFKLEDEQKKLSELAEKLKEASNVHIRKDISGFAMVDQHIASSIDAVDNMHQLVSTIEKGGVFTSEGNWVATGKPSNAELADLLTDSFKSNLECGKNHLKDTTRTIVEAFPENQKRMVTAYLASVKELYNNVVQHLVALSNNAQSSRQVSSDHPGAPNLFSSRQPPKKTQEEKAYRCCSIQ